MNNLELLHDLNRRQARLERDLVGLKNALVSLNRRWGQPEAVALKPQPADPPPLPVPPPLPELPAAVPPIPSLATLPEISAPAAAHESAPVDGPGLELQFGRWLARIGVVFALFTVIFFGALVKERYYHYLGPWSKVTILTLTSSALIALGLRLEKRDSKLLVYGRTLAGGGMACLYYTLYGATYVPQLQVIPSPLLGGCFLLAWSAAVLVLAERRKSELLSIFAISLAYVSSTITPGNGFTMTADLILAATAVIFLLRNSWTGLSYLCLVGTYAGFVRQAVNLHGPFDFDWVGTLDFWPAAVYLTGAWLIFSSAILVSRSPLFAAGKRMAFLCLNNGAWVGLLLVAAQLGAFGHLGEILEATGLALLGACAVAQVTRSDAPDLSGAYLAQGLGLLTGGVAIVYSGVTRGLLITMESVFLVASGAFSRKLVFRLGGGITAVLGAWYLAGELIARTRYPFDSSLLGAEGVLAFGGALAMLANAWLGRRACWGQPSNVADARWVPETILYILLALGLLGIGIGCGAAWEWIFPGLAIASLALALSVYIFPLYELAPLSQALLVAAQALSFGMFGGPASSSHEAWFTLPLWSHGIVALVTMTAATWWSHQNLIRTRIWLQLLMLVYAFGMVAFCYESLRYEVDAQSWMISAALLSLVFLAYGAWSRLWAFAILGQILLAMSAYTSLWTIHVSTLAWNGAAAIPIATVFGTGCILHILSRYGKADETKGKALRWLAKLYQSVAQGMLVRWTFDVAPYPAITFSLITLGTAVVAGGLFLRSSYGVRSGLALSAVGAMHYLTNTGPWNEAFTWLDAGAFALLLAQPALLRRWGRELISTEESWLLIFASSALGWIFVTHTVHAADPHNLTLGWAIFALALTVIGFAANEHRQRWCGLGILVAAFIRVAVHDFWVFSDLLKVLTFLVLTVICLGLSFLYFKFGDRLKEWL